MKKVLITGAAGYIGSVLVRRLLDRGYFVRGLDILNFGEQPISGFHNRPNFEFFKGDVREEPHLKKAVADMDAVVHLAAVVGDPACLKQPDIARETNLKASKMLLDISNDSRNIKRFIFASTCSNYGKMQNEEYVNEESSLRPVSLYAELKVEFEKYLLEKKTRIDFYPVSLRFATAYGLSPRMRFDLTVNEFVKEAALGRELIIYGERFWRPYCHVDDLAEACIVVLESNKGKIDHQVFGVGDTRENYQKKMLAEKILKVLPKAKIKYVHKDEDPRDYKVDFSKIKNTLGFNITKTVSDGIREVHTALETNLVSDPDSEYYRNI